MKESTVREAGVLLAVSSLPSRYGIGCFDRAAYEFIDQLAAAGQSLWQMLPVGPTSYGDSPYQAFSTFAGNPYFISLEALIAQGWLTEAECEEALPEGDPRSVDYGLQYSGRLALLRKAYRRSDLCGTEEFRGFIRDQAEWLDDYALFMALKDAHGGTAWTEWETELRFRDSEALAQAGQDLADDIRYYQFLQFLFFRQLKDLIGYAHEKGIRIIGDIPIYVALDSADTWAAPELFQLDEARRPTHVAGCPPDAFAADGQVWGNPLYRWEVHEKTGYDWWIRRIRNCFATCDVLRIDHFRGFDEYFSIPAADNTAINGEWKQGPGLRLFEAIRQAVGDREIIAEDLGYVTDSVRKLVRDTGYAGIKVFEFAFDSRDTGSAQDYLPHNYPVNSVAYTGTHDNATLTGWLSEITGEERAAVRRYVCSAEPDEDLYWPMICCVLRSVARRAVIPMQDYLGLGSEARMNQPSTHGSNWKWRLLPGEFSQALAERIRLLTVSYGRKETT